MNKKYNILSVDLGNGFVKATNGKIIINYVSSYVSSEKINVSDDLIKQGSVSLFNINNNSIYWGKDIQNPKYSTSTSDLTSTYSTIKKRYNMKEYYILMLATLTELIDEDKEKNIILNLSLPTSDLNKDNIEKIISNMKKKHITYKNGKEFTINIVDINFYPQPFGSLLNGDANINQKIKEISENSFIVIDFGSGTTIIDIYNGGEIIKNKSETIMFGQKNIYQNILLNIRDNSLTISDIENSLKNKRDINIANTKVFYKDIYSIYQEELENFLNGKVYDKLGHILNDNLRTKIIITGGGANLVAPKLKETSLANKMRVIENSQTASLKGMHEFSMFIEGSKNE